MSQARVRLVCAAGILKLMRHRQLEHRLMTTQRQAPPEATTTQPPTYVVTIDRRQSREPPPQPLPMHQYPLNPSCQPTLTQQLPLPLVRGRWRALAWVMLDSDAAVTAAFSRKLATAVSTNKARQPGARHRDNNTYCSLCWAEAMRVTPSTSTSGGHDDQVVSMADRAVMVVVSWHDGVLSSGAHEVLRHAVPHRQRPVARGPEARAVSTAYPPLRPCCRLARPV